MKKQMLILKGPGNTGKSTTIKLAFDMFLQWAIKNEKSSTVHYLYLTEREVAAVIEAGSEFIGVATRGDSEKQVKDGLNFFASHQCKVVLCATRSRGNPLRVAHNFSSTQLGVTPREVIKKKEKGAGQQAANMMTAQQLMKWLKLACC